MLQQVADSFFNRITYNPHYCSDITSVTLFLLCLLLGNKNANGSATEEKQYYPDNLNVRGE